MITAKDLPDNIKGIFMKRKFETHLGKAMSKHKIDCQEDFNKAMDSMKCSDCSDYQDKLCSGKNLVGRDVFNCITDLSNMIFGGSMFDDDNNDLIPGKARKSKKRRRK